MFPETGVPGMRTATTDRVRKHRETLQNNALMTNMDAFRAEMRSEFAALRATNQLRSLPAAFSAERTPHCG